MLRKVKIVLQKYVVNFLVYLSNLMNTFFYLINPQVLEARHLFCTIEFTYDLAKQWFHDSLPWKCWATKPLDGALINFLEKLV